MVRIQGNDGEAPSGIVLLAKQPGVTSFASLSAVKRALGTRKVGHTGTLDSFADGLLVVLTGRLTHLVPHITGLPKAYTALVEFGTETDTLDPTGRVVRSGAIPAEEAVRAALGAFVGEQEQVPPAYSALHLGGRRASDLARSGAEVGLRPRVVTVHSIELLGFSGRHALIGVGCSKGTYIRALARDIARACGTVAHLRALRRTAVGPFRLEDAAGFSALGPFPGDGAAEALPAGGTVAPSDRLIQEIRSSMRPMSGEIARRCGMEPVSLSCYFAEHFSNGKPLHRNAFSFGKPLPERGELCVFYPKGAFAGVVRKDGARFSYSFVVPRRRTMVTYTWEDVLRGNIAPELIGGGTALTIGSFDGPHIGHDALFDAALAQRGRGLVPGVVTFTRSLRAMKNPAEYPGDISSLPQKLDILAAKGFAFAVVIDFSPEFARIEGTQFLRSLLASCRMRFLAEGKDFHCGYRGSTGIAEIGGLAAEGGFELSVVSSVILDGAKVSSTRCRNAILEADFASAAFMLDRPFSLDCSGFEWSERVAGGRRALSARRKGIQILPPDGAYRALAIVEAGGAQTGQKSGEAQSSANVRAYRSDCTVEKGTLRLSFSDKLIGGCVRAVQFGYPDENTF